MSKHALAATVPMLAMADVRPDDRTYAPRPPAQSSPSHDQAPEEFEVSDRLNLLKRRTGADEMADAALLPGRRAGSRAAARSVRRFRPAPAVAARAT